MHRAGLKHRHCWTKVHWASLRTKTSPVEQTSLTVVSSGLQEVFDVTVMTPQESEAWMPWRVTLQG